MRRSLVSVLILLAFFPTLSRADRSFWRKLVDAEYPELAPREALEKALHERYLKLCAERSEAAKTIIKSLTPTQARRLQSQFLTEFDRSEGPVDRTFFREVYAENPGEYAYDVGRYFSSDPTNKINGLFLEFSQGTTDAAKTIRQQRYALIRVISAIQEVNRAETSKLTRDAIEAEASSKTREICVQVTKIEKKLVGMMTEKGFAEDAQLSAEIYFQVGGEKEQFLLTKNNFEKLPNGRYGMMTNQAFFERLKLLEKARREKSEICVPYDLSRQLDRAYVVGTPKLMP